MSMTVNPQQMLPTQEEMALARESGRMLSSLIKSRAKTQQIDLRDSQGAVRTLSVPSAAMRLLLNALTEIGQGNAVAITPIHAELTTQEAADALNVSRPYLVQLLEKGEIAFHKIGTHRRVRHQDVIDYKNRVDIERRKTLNELAAQAQELDMGY